MPPRSRQYQRERRLRACRPAKGRSRSTSAVGLRMEGGPGHWQPVSSRESADRRWRQFSAARRVRRYLRPSHAHLQPTNPRRLLQLSRLVHEGFRFPRRLPQRDTQAARLLQANPRIPALRFIESPTRYPIYLWTQTVGSRLVLRPSRCP
ncbi:hypothetical protein K523DRAFT_279497, partial [Schizophyllum commune Tattone D]